jgi:glyoxylase-like metal-dependent hydrolase (beta-lactamase superfamily II)
MSGVRRALLAVLALIVVAAGLVLHGFSAAPLPAPDPFEGALPPASPPPDMAVFQVPTGVIHRTAAFAYRGGSFRDARDFAMTATLVKHPRGDLLIDTAFGRHLAAHLGEMPFLFRWITSYTVFQPAADGLAAAGYDARKLRGILLTHAHWDHPSGVADFPDTAVWVTHAERRYIDVAGVLTVVIRNTPGVRYEEYGFDDGPYLGFPQSRDVYGDGAIVVVPAPGHTPGSVIVFLALPSGKRYALVGDLAWQREGITEREERPWLWRTLADADPDGVRINLLRMAAIAARFPDIVLVPAHDARGFAAMPVLSH